jgi:hypothetical protein
VAAPIRRAIVIAVLAGLALAGSGGMAQVPEATGSLPDRPPASPVYQVVSDLTPLAITVTEDWQKIEVTVPAELVVSSAPLWRKMHLDDWDRVPGPYRDAGLDGMVRRYGRAAAGPHVWEGMDPFDWDGVPQPIRAVAFIRMARYWADAAGVGIGHPVSRQMVADTLAAVIATESWFEHRAVNVNRGGNRDLGIGQASAFCRRALRAMSAQGLPDVAYGDDDYANPWKAGHAAAVWFGLMLNEADGDLDLAVRAYHRGIGGARRGEAAAYLERVKHHRRWVDGSYAGSPSWRFLAAHAAFPAAPAAATGPAGQLP